MHLERRVFLTAVLYDRGPFFCFISEKKNLRQKCAVVPPNAWASRESETVAWYRGPMVYLRF